MKKVTFLITKVFLAITLIISVITLSESYKPSYKSEYYKKSFEKTSSDEFVEEAEVKDDAEPSSVEVSEIFNTPDANYKEPREVVIAEAPDIGSGNLQDMVIKALDENNRHKINDAIAAGYSINPDCSSVKAGSVCNPFNYVLNQQIVDGKQQLNYKMTEFLSKRDADINAKVDGEGNTIFHVAVQTGLESTKYMFENKADVTVVNNNGDTLLDAAQPEEVINFLVENGIDINYPTVSGSPLLKEYRKNGQSAKTNYLVAKGADINTKDNSGVSLVHEAVKANDIKFLSMLIRKGAETEIMDYSGKKPIDYATGDEYKEVVKILKEANSKKSNKK